jgi:hypothetical protein
VFFLRLDLLKRCGSAIDIVKTLAKKRNDKNTRKEGLSFLFSFEMLLR